MSDDPVLIPGGRDVRGSLDRAGRDGERDAPDVDDDPADGTERADAVVVACPPHPQHRGHRGDERLRAVSDALGSRGVDCLRFDYGDWDEGYGERADVRHAVGWAADRYARVGLFGFSFGGTLALLTAGGGDDAAERLAAVSALAPTARVTADLDAAAATERVACPAQVVYGSRDDTADWRPVVDRARDLEWEVVELAADHFFVGQAPKVGEAVAGFLVPHLVD